MRQCTSCSIIIKEGDFNMSPDLDLKTGKAKTLYCKDCFFGGKMVKNEVHKK